MDVELRLSGERILEIYSEVARHPVDVGAAIAYAPNFSQITTWFERIWDEIQNAMADVYRHGQERIAEWMPQIEKKLGEAKQELGDHSEKLIAMLQKNLLKGACQVHSALLALLPATLTVGTSEAPLTELTVQYQLAIGSDVTASINWALKMSAGATVSVAAKYGVS
jgi:hypothetical protein